MKLINLLTTIATIVAIANAAVKGYAMLVLEAQMESNLLAKLLNTFAYRDANAAFVQACIIAGVLMVISLIITFTTYKKK